MYWEEVYPRLGESHLRMALEREALYAATFPFVDYGADLEVMAELEKGIQSYKIRRTETDAKLPKAKTEEVNRILSEMKSRTYDKVPEKFVGKGHGGYLIYDMVYHKGSGAPKVTKTFRDLVRYHGTTD